MPRPSYSRDFDDSNKHWSPRPDFNKLFLSIQQNWANDVLNARGHIFLNEVYDSLGIPRSRTGAIVGWFKQIGSNPVEFRVVDEVEGAMLLHFNVDGIIYDKLDDWAEQ